MLVTLHCATPSKQLVLHSIYRLSADNDSFLGIRHAHFRARVLHAFSHGRLVSSVPDLWGKPADNRVFYLHYLSKRSDRTVCRVRILVASDRHGAIFVLRIPDQILLQVSRRFLLPLASALKPIAAGSPYQLVTRHS